MIECKNCATQYVGKFCPECGQKSKTKRITIKQVMADVRDQLVHFDKGFVYTIRELALRPGLTLKAYLEGKRVRHVKPIRFLFWSSAINILLSAYGKLEERIMDSVQQTNGQQISQESRAMGHIVMEFVNRHPGLINLLTVPTIALCAWFLFKKKGYNYAEHFTVNVYLMGQLSLLSIVLTSIMLLTPGLSLSAMMWMGVLQWLIWSLYFGWAYSTLTGATNRFWGWLKGVLVLIGGYTLLIVVFSLITSVVVMFYQPELKEMLQQPGNPAN